MPELETTNMWLAILAVASVVQVAVLVGGAIALFVVYKRTSEMLERMEERHLAPISAKVAHIVDEFEDLATRARRVDDSVRDGVQHANNLVWSVATKAWPVLGAARAVKAGLQVLGERMASGDDVVNRRRSAGNADVRDFERRKHNVS